MEKECLSCSNKFIAILSEIRRNGGKYCSRTCSYKRTPWNKGVPWSEEVKEKLRGPRPNTLGEKNHSWKGDDIGYYGAHNRISRILGKPKECTKCGLNDKNRRYEWANLTGKFTDTSDYIRLCVPCHRKSDVTDETRRKLREANLGRVPWNKGKKETRPDVIKKMSESRLRFFANKNQ